MAVESLGKTEEIIRLKELGKHLKGKKEYRRLQCVLMRVAYGKSPEEIAEFLQIHKRTVYKHQERYRLEGWAAFEPGKPGPKEGPRLMTGEEEKALLEELEAQASQGKLITAAQVKKAYEEKIGKPVGKSKIYVLLHSNKWSKQQPRPKHPKGDEEAKRLFKKTTGKKSRKLLIPF